MSKTNDSIYVKQFELALTALGLPTTKRDLLTLVIVGNNEVRATNLQPDACFVIDAKVIQMEF